MSASQSLSTMRSYEGVEPPCSVPCFYALQWYPLFPPIPQSKKFILRPRKVPQLPPTLRPRKMDPNFSPTSSLRRSKRHLRDHHHNRKRPIQPYTSMHAPLLLVPLLPRNLTHLLSLAIQSIHPRKNCWSGSNDQ